VALRTDDRLIGKHTYRVRQLPYLESLAVLPYLPQMLGPTLAAVLEGTADGELAALMSSAAKGDGEEGKGGLLNADVSALFPLLARILREAAMLPDESIARALQSVAKAFAKTTCIVGSKEKFGVDEAELGPLEAEHWPAHWSEWAGWIAFCIEVNYSSFLGDKLSAGVLSGLAKAPSSSQSPTASTGGSGGS